MATNMNQPSGPVEGPPQPRDDLATLSGYHSPQVDVAVRLNTNEAPQGPPPAFTAALMERLATVDWHRYPDRSASELRTKIAATHKVDSSNVFAANGSNEVLQTVLMTFAGSGRKVLTFEPTYALHQHIARIVGADRVTADRAEDFTLDVDIALAAIAKERPAVTFLCSPNNPTGVVDSPETVRQVAEAVRDIGGLLVVDEAYGQFSEWSALSLLQDATLGESLAISRTYSKTWAMAGVRLGYLVASPRIISELEKVVLPYHLNAMTQAAGSVALEFVADMNRRVNEIVSEREQVQRRLVSLGCHVWPSGANFVLFRPPNGDGDRVWNDLVSQSVLVRNTASWPGLSGCLRVTIGTAADNARFCDALEGTLNPSS